MVQFKVDDENQEGYSCDDCKSFMEDFCYKWSFPILRNHVPCTKFKYLKKIEDQIAEASTEEGKNELLQEFFQELRKVNKQIDGKTYLEIYTDFDDLISKYAQKLL